MTMVAKTLTPLPDVYAAICGVVQKNREFVEPINRFVRSRHDTANLAILYAHRTISEEDKRATFKAIIEAMQARDMSRLAATIPPAPAGRIDVASILSSVKPAESRMNGTLELIDETPATKPAEVDDDETLPEDDEDETEEAPAKPADSKLNELQRLLSEIVTPKSAPIDASAVNKIVSKHIESVNKRLTSELDAMHGRLAELVKSGGGTSKLEITINGATHTVEGLTHCQLPQVVTWVGANVPLWLWGKAGGGKTHLFYQVAAALGIKPYVVSIDPTTTINKLLGYRNLATGEFVEGLIYKPFKEGGLFAPDELDTGDPGVIAGLNALLANGHFMFPNGELVTRHPDFRVIVGANTKGTGAVAGYTARNRLDAATLDRFAVIEFGYDEGLERALCLGGTSPTSRWQPVKPPSEAYLGTFVDWVQKIRRAAGESVLVSPRASYNGVKALRAGIPPAEVAEALVFKLVTSDTKARLINAAGSLPVL